MPVPSSAGELTIDEQLERTQTQARASYRNDLNLSYANLYAAKNYGTDNDYTASEDFIDRTFGRRPPLYNPETIDEFRESVQPETPARLVDETTHFPPAAPVKAEPTEVERETLKVLERLETTLTGIDRNPPRGPFSPGPGRYRVVEAPLSLSRNPSNLSERVENLSLSRNPTNITNESIPLSERVSNLSDLSVSVPNFEEKYITVTPPSESIPKQNLHYESNNKVCIINANKASLGQALYALVKYFGYPLGEAKKHLTDGTTLTAARKMLADATGPKKKEYLLKGVPIEGIHAEDLAVLTAGSGLKGKGITGKGMTLKKKIIIGEVAAGNNNPILKAKGFQLRRVPIGVR